MGKSRVSTGAEGLDGIIGGGLVEGRSYLVAGEPGTGKTLFCMQYLLEGIRKGEKGLFVSIDERPEHLIEDAASLGWDLKPLIEAGSLVILDVSERFIEARASREKKIEVERVADNLLAHVKKSGVKRLVIDPIAPLVSRSDAISEVQEYIKRLVFLIEDSGCTTLITSHVPAGSSKLSQYDVEEFVASGILLLRLVKPDKKYVRTIFVRKMRSTAVDLSEWMFDIVSGKGLVLRQPM